MYWASMLHCSWQTIKVRAILHWTASFERGVATTPYLPPSDIPCGIIATSQRVVGGLVIKYLPSRYNQAFYLVFAIFVLYYMGLQPVNCNFCFIGVRTPAGPNSPKGY